MNMKNKILIIASLILLPLTSSAQILEVIPEDIKPIVERPARTGMTYSGTTGLVTIPAPDFQEERRVGFTYKAGTYKQDIGVNGVPTKLEKDEFVAGFRAAIHPDLELSVLHMNYQRKSDPKVAGLNFKEDSTALGMKYSTHVGEKDLCLGFNFAPMDANELNLADLEQIEKLRNVYMTVSETVASGVTGFLNVTSAFTKKQEIDFGNGTKQKIDRKDIIIGSLGLEYRFKEFATFFCEAKFGNYRDVFQKDSVRHRLHAGFRVGLKSFQAEVLGLNLSEDNPTLVLGGTVSF